MTPEDRAWFRAFGLALCNNNVSAFIFPLSFGLATGLFIIALNMSIGRGFGTIPRKIILLTILTSYLLHALTTFSYIVFVKKQIRQALIYQGPDGTIYDFVTALIIPRWAGQFQLIINDAVVVWRAWVLYPNHKAPRIFLVVLFTIWVGFSMPTTILGSDPRTSFSVRIETASIAKILDDIAFCLSFVTNLVATLLILHRLRIQRRSHRHYWANMSSMTGGQRLLLVLVESGLVFCIFQIIDIVFFLATPSDLGWPKFSPEPRTGAASGTAGPNSQSDVEFTLQIVFNVFDSCFWSFMPFYPLIIFIFVHTKHSIVETFGFTEAFKTTIPDAEQPPVDGSIAIDSVTEDSATTAAADAIIINLDPKSPASSSDAQISEISEIPQTKSSPF